VKNWNDIKKPLQHAEEPLSDTAWEDMSALLDGQKLRSKKGIWVGLALLGLLFFGGGLFLFQPQDAKQYYAPRNIEKTTLKPSTLSSGWVDTDKNKNVQKSEVVEAPTFAQTKNKSLVPVKNRNANQSSETSLNSLGGNSTEIQNLHEEYSTGFTQRFFTYKNIPAILQKNIPNNLNFMDNEIEPLQDEKAKATGFELRFYMAPTYNMPSFTYNVNEEKKHKDFAKATQNAMKPGWGIDAGFEMRYRLSRNLLISSGFSYREIITQNNYDFEVNEIPVIDSATGNILAYLPISQSEHRVEQSNNMFGFFNIPVSLYFEKPLASGWTVTGEAIHHTSILLNQSSYKLNPTTLEIQPERNKGLNKVINGYQLRVGLRYKVQDNFYLALEPSYRAYYQDFITDPNVSWKPRDFSVSLSAIVKFYK